MKPSRLESLTDGIFAFAMTLLVLGISLPTNVPKDFAKQAICGQEGWLEGGYVGSSYGSDIAQYFTDPIFYSNPRGAQRQSWQQTYYPYFGEEFFRDYSKPYQFRPGKYPGPYGVFPFNPAPYYSDFRLKSLAGLQWLPIQKNWSETINYARTKSSMRIYQNGTWVTP